MSEVLRELVVIPVPSGEGGYSTSGLQLIAPRIYGAYHTPRGQRPKVGVIVMHPTSNFMDHYLLAPLAAAGIGALGLNSRFVNNEPALLVEMLVHDLAAGVSFLQERGIERVVLVGNSGGGALVSLYQRAAEHPGTIRNDLGEALDLGGARLVPAAGIMLVAAHAGRPETLTEYLDPSVVDEADPLSRDASLDMFDPSNGPPYPAAWLARYRAAQVARSRRITAWARERIAGLAGSTVRDLAFLVHRTCADPRFLDLGIEPSDRAVGSSWGDPRKLNEAALFLARFTSLRSWLSQWSLEASHLAGPKHLAHTSCPVLVASYTADQAAFPSHSREFFDAIAHERKSWVEVKGANHYLVGQQHLLEGLVRTLTDWIEV